MSQRIVFFQNIQHVNYGKEEVVNLVDVISYKMIDATVFKDNQECKQAIIHGMVIASMLTSRCKQIEINEVAGMKKCIILEIENKTDFENKMNEYLSEGYKIEASSCNSKYYKALMVLEKE